MIIHESTNRMRTINQLDQFKVVLNVSTKTQNFPNLHPSVPQVNTKHANSPRRQYSARPVFHVAALEATSRNSRSVTGFHPITIPQTRLTHYIASFTSFRQETSFAKKPYLLLPGAIGND